MPPSHILSHGYSSSSPHSLAPGFLSPQDLGFFPWSPVSPFLGSMDHVKHSQPTPLVRAASRILPTDVSLTARVPLQVGIRSGTLPRSVHYLLYVDTTTPFSFPLSISKSLLLLEDKRKHGDAWVSPGSRCHPIRERISVTFWCKAIRRKGENKIKRNAYLCSPVASPLK